uniref:Polyprotein n=1 Tax=Castanea betaflexivirus 1 TaxID=2794402 RepID=A0A7T5QZ49_9VIRU|nr:polyprotein [Castanea betaflexivirus 1]
MTSLTYRTPAENLIHTLPSRQTENISSVQVDCMSYQEESIGKYMNMHLSSEKKKFLVDHGVYLSPYSWQNHSHPACKTIENWFLYHELPLYMNNCELDKLSFISLRKGKLVNVKNVYSENKKDKKSVLEQIKAFNRDITAKDATRYCQSKDTEKLGKNFDELKKAKMKDGVFFVHDEMHYWSPKDVTNFFEHTNAETVIGTIVVPPETIVGKKKSFLPSVYDFEVKGDSLFFFPDGNKSEMYQQPAGAYWWLRCKGLKYSDQFLSISFLKSIGPFHLVVIRRGNYVSEDQRFFDDFELMDFSSNGVDERFIDFEPNVRASTFKKIVLYFKSLQKVTKETINAKYRMMSEEGSSTDELLFFEAFGESVLKHGLAKVMDVNFLDSITRALKLMFPGPIQNLFFHKFFMSESNTEVIKSIKPLEISTKTLVLNCDTNLDEQVKRLLVKFRHIKSLEDSDPICDLINRNQDRGSYIYGGDYNGYSSHKTKMAIKWPNSQKKLHTDAAFVKGPLIDVLEIHHPEKKEILTHISECVNWGFGLDDEFPIEKVLEYAKPVFKNDPERHAKACRVNYAFTSELLDDYYCPIPTYTEECNDTVFGASNLLFCFYPTSVKTERKGRDEFPSFSYCEGFIATDGAQFERMGFYLSFGLYCPHKMLTSREHKDSDYYYAKSEFESFKLDEQMKRARLVKGHAIDTCLEDLTKGMDDLDYDDSAYRYSENNDFNYLDLKKNCTFECLRKFLEISEDFFLELLGSKPRLMELLKNDCGLLLSDLKSLLEDFGVHAKILEGGNVTECGRPSIEDEEKTVVSLKLKANQDSEILKQIKKKINEETIFLVCSEDHCIKLNESEFDANCRNQGKVEPGAQIRVYTDIERVRKLFKSFQSGKTGVFVCGEMEKAKKERNSTKRRQKCSVKVLNHIEEVLNILDEINFDVEYISGAAGSGKTRNLIQRIRDHPNEHFCVIVPRKELAKSWETENLSNCRIMTFEKAICSDLSDCELIVDELGLFPPGYLGLIKVASTIGLKPKLSSESLNSYKLTCLGDHYQGRYYNESDQRSLSNISEIDYLIGEAELSYLNYSRRQSPENNYDCGVVKMGPRTEKTKKNYVSVELAKKHNPEAQILVASHDEKERFKNYSAITIGESQGLSFDEVILVLSPPLTLVSNNLVHVAMTRSRFCTHFALNGYSCMEDFNEKVRGTFTFKAVNGIPFNIHSEIGFTREKVECRLHEPKGLRSKEEIEQKLSGDPYLKSYIPLQEPIFEEEAKIIENLPPEALPKSKVAFGNIEYHMAHISDMLKNRESREFRGDSNMSEQFPDFFKKGEPGFRFEGPSRFQAIYPKHSNDDKLTFLEAVKKRIHLSSPQREKEKMDSVLHLSDLMFEEFLKFVPLDPGLNKKDFEDSIQEYVEKKTDKPENLIANHSKRSEPDWNIKEVLLFMKTQLCTKKEKRFCQAKAGQTLACFSHVVLNRFAPMCRYMEKKINGALPRRFYIHQKKNFEELEKWVKEFDFSGECTESDYEAFDSSQDALVLGFEIKIMQYLGLPEDVVNDYRELKMTLGCRLGNFAIMRFTGEFGTFLFNTLCNMAYTFMYYDINHEVAISFAGDDMCANAVLKKRGDEKFKKVLEKLSLKAKVQITQKPTFCGWRLFKRGLFKQPELVLERLLISIEKGTLDQTINSYCLELSYAYSKGDELLFQLSDIELNAHHVSLRIIHKYKSKLKGSVLDFFLRNDGLMGTKLSQVEIFEEKETEVFGETCPSSTQMNSLPKLRKDQRPWTLYLPGYSTRIVAMDQTRPWTFCTGVKMPSPSSLLMELNQLSLEFPSLTYQHLRDLERTKSTDGFTLLPFQCPFILFSTLTNHMNSQENAASWTKDFWMEEPSCKLLSLTYQKNQPTMCSTQTSNLTKWILCLQKLVRYISSSTTQTSSKRQDHLPLKLEAFIDLQTALKRSLRSGEVLLQNSWPYATHNRYHLQIWILSTSKCWQLNFVAEEPTSSLMWKLTTPQATEGNCSYGENKDLEHTRLSRLSQKLDSSSKEAVQLGRTGWSLKKERNREKVISLGVYLDIQSLTTFWGVHLSLQLTLEELMETEEQKRVREEEQKKNSSSKSSGTSSRAITLQLKNWVYSRITPADWGTGQRRLIKLRRRFLLRNHWVLALNKQFTNIKNHADPAKFSDDEKAMYKNIMQDFAAYTFGILAGYSFSDGTKYPEIEHTFSISYDEPIQTKEITIIPSKVAIMFRYYADQANVPELNGLTWRNIGECFFEDQRRYYKELEPMETTWLRKSNPALAEQAPWMALDTTGGADIALLSSTEKKMITKVNHHLQEVLSMRSNRNEDSTALLTT